MVDDLGAECLNSYGGTSYETPFLNKMSEDGMQFENAHSMPICTPSRVKLMTGKSNKKNSDILDLVNVRGKIMSDTRETIYITSDFATKSDMRVGAEEWQEIIQQMLPKFKKAGAIRQTVSQIWNKEGVFRLGNMWEYKDEKAFIACQNLFREAEIKFEQKAKITVKMPRTAGRNDDAIWFRVWASPPFSAEMNGPKRNAQRKRAKTRKRSAARASFLHPSWEKGLLMWPIPIGSVIERGWTLSWNLSQTLVSRINARPIEAYV